MAVDEGVPAGWRLVLDPSTRCIDGGRVVVGGTPLRVLRLSAAGARLVDRLTGGGPEGGGDPQGRGSGGVGAPVPDSSGARALARRLVDAGMAHPVPPPGAGPTAADVTVVIPVLDDAAGLARTLAALGPVAAVVVVDDGSADPAALAAVVDRHRSVDPDVAATDAAPTPERGRTGPIRLVRHESPLGPAAARNTGWQAATSEVVAFVDADVVPQAGWLPALLAHLGDPMTAAVAPRVRSTAGAATTPGWLVAYEDLRSSLDLGPTPAPVRPGSRVPYVPTAALVVRRDALEAVGGFHGALRVGEDVDLVWRLAAAGHRLRYEPAVAATHPARPTTGAWLRQRFRYGTAAADLAAAHGGAAAPLQISGWSAAAWGLVGLGHPVAGAALAAGTTVALTPKLRNLDRPLAEAGRIAGLGNLHAGRVVADALRRPWWPAAAALAAVHRRSRPALLAAVVVPPLLERRQQRAAATPPPTATTRPTAPGVAGRRRLGVGAYVVARLADDLAYGTGVLAGCWRRRSSRALRPALTGPFRSGDD